MIASWKEKTNQKLGEVIFKSTLIDFNNDDLNRITVRKVLTFIIACSVIAIPLTMFIGGIVYFLIDYDNIEYIMPGLILAAAGFFLLPSVKKLKSEVLTPSDAPLFFELVDNISKKLDAPSPKKLTIVPDFNAFITNVGYKQDTVLGIGASLWACLSPQEKVALIAHEIAHEVNGDPARGTMIGMANHTLEKWYYLCVDQDPHERMGMDALIQTLLLLIGQFFKIPYYVLNRIALLDSQRAEYLADGLAANVSGKDHFINLLKKITCQYEMEASIGPFIRKNFDSLRARPKGFGIDFLNEISKSITEMDEETYQKRMRLMELEETSIDATHPPTKYRIAFLIGLKQSDNILELEKAQMDRIDKELEHHFDEAGQKVFRINAAWQS